MKKRKMLRATLKTLKRFKDDVQEVAQNYECGLVLDFNEIEDGDIVRIFPGDSPEVFDKAPYGKIFLDGNIGVEEESKSIKERRFVRKNW